jgi:hypothetical protein
MHGVGGGIGDHRLTLYGALAYALNHAVLAGPSAIDPYLSHAPHFPQSGTYAFSQVRRLEFLPGCPAIRHMIAYAHELPLAAAGRA